MDLTPYRAFIAELADQSGDFIRPLYGRTDLAVETKGDATPVTLADRGAEELMRRLIRRKFPTHGVIGEEFGSDRPDAEFVWVLDPVDGTKSFITGVPLWGTLIALLHRGAPVLGVINQPYLKQFMVGDGVSTTLNGRTVHVRPMARIEDATLLTTNVQSPAKYQNGPAFDALAASAKLFRAAIRRRHRRLVSLRFDRESRRAEQRPHKVAAVFRELDDEWFEFFERHFGRQD